MTYSLSRSFIYCMCYIFSSFAVRHKQQKNFRVAQRLQRKFIVHIYKYYNTIIALAPAAGRIAAEALVAYAVSIGKIPYVS